MAKPIRAKSGGDGEFELPPIGVYLARCYQMIDVGTQTSTGQYGTKKNRTVYIYWELLQDDEGDAVFMEDGEHVFSLFNSYTLSTNAKANLRKHIDAWRGIPLTDEQAEDFDITVLLDKFCKIQVTQTKSKDGSRTYANVGTIMSTKKKAEGVNPVVSFSIDDPDTDVFNALPEWLQNKIEDAPEWADMETEEETEAPAPANKAGKPAKTAPVEEEDDDEMDIADVPF